MVSRTDKFRGSRTHGRGKKSGRGAGKHGGTGNAGLHKHKAMHMLKYMPDHFGRHGFKRPQKMVCAMITMNVCDIDQSVEQLVKDGSAQKTGRDVRPQPNGVRCRQATRLGQDQRRSRDHGGGSHGDRKAEG